MAAIYSKRWSTARGWSVVKERECLAEDAASWLAMFEGDEPSVTFVVGDERKAPKLKTMGG